MKLRLIFPASAAIVLASSCTPYVEQGPPPPTQQDPAQRKQDISPEEQDKIRKQREAMKERDRKAQEEGADTSGKPTDRPKDPNSGGGDGAGEGGGSEKPPTSEKPKPTVIPTARPIPGKPGMVFSPFNNKPIDVKGIPSGKLVADPTYPPSEKKHFRVP